MRADKLARVLATLTRAREFARDNGEGIVSGLYREILDAEWIIERGLAESEVWIEPGKDEEEE